MAESREFNGGCPVLLHFVSESLVDRLEVHHLELGLQQVLVTFPRGLRVVLALRQRRAQTRREEEENQDRLLKVQLKILRH